VRHSAVAADVYSSHGSPATSMSRHQSNVAQTPCDADVMVHAMVRLLVSAHAVAVPWKACYNRSERPVRGSGEGHSRDDAHQESCSARRMAESVRGGPRASARSGNGAGSADVCHRSRACTATSPSGQGTRTLRPELLIWGCEMRRGAETSQRSGGPVITSCMFRCDGEAPRHV